jgi:hypothetical protein
MKPSTPKTELSPSNQLRKVVFGGFLKVMCFAMHTTTRNVFLCAAFFCAWICGAALAGANTILTFEPESLLLEGKTFETLINQDYGDNVVTTNDLTSPFRYGGAKDTPNIVVSYAPVNDPSAGRGVRFVGANSIFKDDGTFNYGPTGDLTNIITVRKLSQTRTVLSLPAALILP